MTESLGKRLFALRKKKGASVVETARQVSVATSTYRDWEQGRQIKGEPYVALAEFFDVSINYLLTGRYLDIERSLLAIEKHVKKLRKYL